MPSPVRHTCPDIDKAIKEIRAAMKAAEYGIRKNEDEYGHLEGIRYELYDTEGKLEDLRASNLSLRTYAEEMEAVNEKLQEEMNRMEPVQE